MLIIIVVLTVALTTIVLTMTAPKLYQKLTSNVEKGNNQWYSFFWAASFMASLCIIAVLLCEILAVAVTDIPTVIRL